MRFLSFFITPLTFAWIMACGTESRTAPIHTDLMKHTDSTTDTAIFGAGCFWCTEAQFEMLEGVIDVKPGYAGGHTDNPSYKEVCTGLTGHAEVAQIIFDPSRISYDELLEAFWLAHDPTQLNRQGNDIGTQYRSAIFYTNEEQRQLAETYKDRLNKEKVYQSPIVTTIEPLLKFWPAESYHEDYYRNNPDQGYCRLVIQPKVEKFKKVFKNKLNNKEK